MKYRFDRGNGNRDVDRGKGFNPWGEARPLRAKDTVNMVEDEEKMLALVDAHQPINAWDLYVMMDLGSEDKGRIRLYKMMALCARLIREGKLIRIRSHLGLQDAGFKVDVEGIRNVLAIGPSYVPVMPDIQDAQNPQFEDLGGHLRDVDCLSSLTEE